jgi:hypothetical protein
LYTPDPSCSQQTIFSPSDTDFAWPGPLLPIPESLERVGPDRTKAYILYSEMSKDAFVAWWLETDFGKKKCIHWDGRHHAKCWEQFEQVAHGKTGKPGVMCTHYRAVLDHPASGHTGTSSMNKHINGPGCRKSTGRTTNILASMQRAVCEIVLLNNLPKLTPFYINRHTKPLRSLRSSSPKKYGSTSCLSF